MNIYFGIGELTKLPSVLKKYRKPLLVIGQGSIKKVGLLDRVELLLKGRNINYLVFEGIEPNPRASTIDKAVEIAHTEQIDAVVAIGGGSVMDASKLIASVKYGTKTWDYLLRKNPLKLQNSLPLITVPTVSATGSETNQGAVITNEETKEKYAIHSKYLIPKVAIIDPELTITVPRSYLVDGAIDIITHTLEHYLSNSNELNIADNITLAIAKTVKEDLEYILQYMDTGKDLLNKHLVARESMAWSASLAINGMLNIQKSSWPIHTVEHYISALYDISHGAGLSFLLAPFMYFNTSKNKRKILKFISYFLHGSVSFYKDVNKAIQDFIAWQKSVGAGSSSKYSLNDMDIKSIVDKVFQANKEPIYNCIPIGINELTSILEKMMDTWNA